MEAVLSEITSKIHARRGQFGDYIHKQSHGRGCERLAGQLGREDIASDLWTGTFHSVCLRMLPNIAETGRL